MKINAKLAVFLAFLQVNLLVADTSIETLVPSELTAQMIGASLKTDTPKRNEDFALQSFNASLSEYIVGQYNKEGYIQHISQNGNDFLLLLEAIKDAELGQEESLVQAYTIFKLFNDKLKAAMAVDDSVINQILPQLPALIKDYFKVERVTSVSELKNEIEFMLQSKLLEHFDEFADSPEKTLSKVSQELAVDFKQRQQSLIEQLENINKLRNIIARFFENILGKAIWSMRSYEGIWHSVLSISNGLRKLYIHHIINDEDELDGMYWALTHRFCFFLGLRGSFLPISFYNEVEEDLATNVIPFLEEEQDELIKTKKQTLAEALTEAKLKALAYTQNGVFSDEMV